MAWSRGFFRLWIVLTLLWLGAVFAGLGKDEFKGLWRPNVEIEVEYPGDAKDTLDSSRPPDELRRQIIDGVKRGAAQLQRTDPAEAKRRLEEANTGADELLKVMVDENKKRADRLQRALVVALAPPVALLVLGIAIAWVAGGFRSSIRNNPDSH